MPGGSLIGVVSGGFDPVHAGHVRLLNDARLRCDQLVVLLNSDAWLARKKGQPFMAFEHRRQVLLAMRAVDVVLPVVDNDGSVVRGLWDLWHLEVEIGGNRLAFFNGGDRQAANTPEVQYCTERGITLVWGVGGDKLESSAALTERARHAPPRQAQGSGDSVADATVALTEPRDEPRRNT